MQNTVNEQGIRFLLHFTQASNLSSIFEHGILPITDLQSKRIFYSWNDAYRLDGCHNASCFSIEVPNYKMFYKYRKENPQLDWVVLGIRKEILWEKDCALCVENAASTSVTQTPIESRIGVQAFRRLYDEFPNKPTRKALNLDPVVPTNPQAEVLVFGKVEPSYIFSVCFEDDVLRDKYKHYVPNTVNVEIQKWLYEPRHDYEHWR
ncbi:DarT ssDNA thymidine ADP-ribosyltransferase family protein [Bacillus altitudinis]|uniref:DarT ssDNA thymidine ADP-ribosyltransferase family protein n=1 Tax=Bacillus altitudinis TaxID=293387 RepID=UPI002E1E9F85|nr:DarT ssDNA thymidine ADP-ribosyltransferase family protein [Bacillus altitudinis]